MSTDDVTSEAPAQPEPRFEIKSITGGVLFVSRSSSVKAALVDAVSQRADLRGAYLRGADLQGAYLQGADLQGAYLQGADLQGAYLRGAYLRGADLRGAYLRGADLQGAYLQGAYLQGADLQGADLQGAKNADLVIARTRILPDDGDIIGWKKAVGTDHDYQPLIVKLRIPDGAKRSHASGRKCRAEQAEVLAITDLDGNDVPEARSIHDSSFLYKVGETVTPTRPFDTDMWNECAAGIHFFITKLEAKEYGY